MQRTNPKPTGALTMATETHTYVDQPLKLPIATHGVVVERHGRVLYTNVPHLVEHHSPDGFEIGYMGSGPSDLALNILEWYLRHTHAPRTVPVRLHRGRCHRLAWDLHHPFKVDFLGELWRGGTRIPLPAIAAWMATHCPQPSPKG
jgi:hypothetical protein